MSSKRKGTVSKIGKSKFSYFVQLDSDGFYFNTKYDPKCGVGDVVGITFEPKGDTRGQITAIKILEDKGGPKGMQAEGDSGGGGGKSGGTYTASPDRQDSIIYQSSRKDALVLAGILVSNDGIKLPKDTDKRRTIIEALVDETTLVYFRAAEKPREALKAEAKTSDDADGDDWEGGSDDKQEDFDDDWS